jgi:hypothetical protein
MRHGNVVACYGCGLSACAADARAYAAPELVRCGNAPSVMQTKQLLEADGWSDVVRVVPG